MFLIGLAATYIPLWAEYRDVDIWGMAWELWAMIGVTIMWLSLGGVIIRLFLTIRRLTSEDANRVRKHQEAQTRLAQAQYDQMSPFTD